MLFYDLETGGRMSVQGQYCGSGPRMLKKIVLWFEILFLYNMTFKIKNLKFFNIRSDLRMIRIRNFEKRLKIVRIRITGPGFELGTFR